MITLILHLCTSFYIYLHLSTSIYIYLQSTDTHRYKVLEQKQGVTEGGLFASSRTYALDAGSSEEAGTGLGDSQEADLADMGEEGEGGGISVIAKDVTGTGGNEGEKKVKKKRSRVESGGGALAKKAKEFKF